MNKTTYLLTPALWLSTALASAQPTPGASGIGDPYFPHYGNGGYDVEHYDIRLNYDPTTDHVLGTTSILAKAKQDLPTCSASRRSLGGSFRATIIRSTKPRST